MTLTVTRHRSPLGSWELARRAPVGPLAPYAREICGYHEWTPTVLRRREVPGTQIVLIADFGEALRLVDPRRPEHVTSYRGGFVAGLDDTFTVTESPGEIRCVQVNLGLAAARALLGVPMTELTGRVVSLEDLLGPGARGLRDRLGAAEGWAARLRLVEEMLLARLGRGPEVPGWVAEGWRRIEAAGGRLSIGALAGELGYSRKHVAAGFREHLGLPPKRLARLVRFEHVIRRLRVAPDPPRDWAAFALDHGYADQSHLVRELHELSGYTPAELVRHLLPDGGLSG